MLYFRDEQAFEQALKFYCNFEPSLNTYLISYSRDSDWWESIGLIRVTLDIFALHISAIYCVWAKCHYNTSEKQMTLDITSHQENRDIILDLWLNK